MASVRVKQLKSLGELAAILDKVVEQEAKFDARFPSDLTKIQMASKIISMFGDYSYCWGELYENGELKFFALVQVVDSDTCYWHILYNHPRNKSQTKTILAEIKDFLKAQAFKEIVFVTRRITPSYKRFMAKQNAFQHEITYKCKL